MANENSIFERLIDIGTGKIKHLNAGKCPSDDDREQTDYHCPACRILVVAKRNAREVGLSNEKTFNTPVYYRFVGKSVTGMKEEMALLVERRGVTFSHEGWQKSTVTIPQGEISTLVSMLLDASDAIENLDRIGYIPHKN